MGRPKNDLKPTSEMLARAKEWAKFREANLLTQKTLSEVTGISRRTIQNIEAAKECSPLQRILDAFATLQAKYAAEGKPTGQRKRKQAA